MIAVLSNYDCRLLHLTYKQQKEKRELVKQAAKNYPQYLRSEHWQSRRRAVLKILGEKCQQCGSTENIQVHHKTYENLYSEPLHDLEVLCRSCHYDHHKLELLAI